MDTPKSGSMPRIAMRGRALSLAVAAVLALSAAPAQAQLSRILKETNLSPSDIAIATAAAEEVYSRPGVRVGETIEWINPETGSVGTVRVTKVEPGANCVSFRHVANARNKKERRFDMRRCKNAENNWILVPD